MSDALDVTVTLEDVFSVVQGKRVPLAPELAGYLALEIAEKSDGKSGDVDPKSVHIAEEGTVVLVKKREPNGGSTDGSIRAILAKLLEATGSQTPALASTSRRRATGNMRALIEELEAALIPVNRAAGRRALARLAREVKRVTQGVGRNASVPAARGPSSSQPAARAQEPTPYPEEERKAEAPGPLPETPLAPPPQRRPPPPAFAPVEDKTAKRDVGAELRKAATPTHHVIEVQRPPPPGPVPPPLVSTAPVPPPPVPPPLVPPSHVSPPIEPPASMAPSARMKAAAEVDSLLAEFLVSNERADQAVARDLKAMAGLDPTPPPPPQARASAAPQADAGVESLLAMSEPVKARGSASMRAAPPAPGPLPKVEPPPRRPSSPGAESERRVPAAAPAREERAVRERAVAPAEPPPPAAQAVTAPALRPASRASSSDELLRSPKKKGGSSALLIVVGVLIAVLAVAIVLMVKMPAGFLTGRTAEKIAEEKAQNEAIKAKQEQDRLAAACRATLTVTDIPNDAEVLLRVGQAPVDVDHMPAGARLEFVATAEGYMAKRAVVPSGATWDPGPAGKPRFEVAVQLDKATKGKADVWPPGEPGSQVGGQGPPGTVHVVSTPRGAEIWLLAGVGPEAKIEQLVECGQDADLLLAGPTTYRKRLHVNAADFAGDPKAGGAVRTAKVSAK